MAVRRILSNYFDLLLPLQSLYIVDRRMVVMEGGNVLRHIIREQNCGGGLSDRNMSRGNVRIPAYLRTACYNIDNITNTYLTGFRLSHTILHNHNQIVTDHTAFSTYSVLRFSTK